MSERRFRVVTMVCVLTVVTGLIVPHTISGGIDAIFGWLAALVALCVWLITATRRGAHRTIGANIRRTRHSPQAGGSGNHQRPVDVPGGGRLPGQHDARPGIRQV
ncbi:exported hypothetical protein [Rhodococcus sp. RD6.2]|uniref:hypothetical protein n=1 Tax=Rhodococcus sp. RD6.2 TaxID=260936 RepID=UPI00063B2F1A|nr:hypothetical protein [Rhodococcus sp. RD6.2]CRK52139.1 exported hypothetical protein [Rhodococcus sp. RD6.2]